MGSIKTEIKEIDFHGLKELLLQTAFTIKRTWEGHEVSWDGHEGTLKIPEITTQMKRVYQKAMEGLREGTSFQQLDYLHYKPIADSAGRMIQQIQYYNKRILQEQNDDSDVTKFIQRTVQKAKSTIHATQKEINEELDSLKKKVEEDQFFLKTKRPEIPSKQSSAKKPKPAQQNLNDHFFFSPFADIFNFLPGGPAFQNAGFQRTFFTNGGDGQHFFFSFNSNDMPAAAPTKPRIDPYKTLGIEPNATKAEIKKAYHALAKEWHPDKNKGLDAKEKFQEIQEAYEMLTKAN